MHLVILPRDLKTAALFYPAKDHAAFSFYSEPTVRLDPVIHSEHSKKFADWAYSARVLGHFCGVIVSTSDRFDGFGRPEVITVLRNQELHPRSVMPVGIKHALAQTYGDVLRNHTMQMAAALSYYFVLSLFPALIFLSAVVAFLPLPDLFN